MAWIVEALRWMAFGSLSFLPGAWVAFGVGPRGGALAARIIVAFALTPFILAVQFYLLQVLGVPFGPTTLLLVLANLSALFFVVPALRGTTRPKRRTVLGFGAASALPLAYLIAWIGDTQFRANFGHSWTHTSVSYLLANGQLRPEEPLLAGVRLAYPWLAHISQLLYSATLDVSPSASYLWTNLLWLGVVFLAVATLVRTLGGPLRAQAASVLLLSFSVNVFGYLYGRIVPREFAERYPIYGDFRFTPWLRKIGVFEPTVAGIGIFTGLLVVACQPWTGAFKRLGPVAMAVGLVGLALLYPILLPAGCVVAASRVAVSVVQGYRDRSPGYLREPAVVLGCVILAVVLGTGYLEVVTVDRVTGSGLGIATLWSMKMKAVGAVLAFAIPLAGLLWRGRAALERAPTQALVLALSGLGCVALWIVLDIYHIRNEYKYVFPAAIALTPFAALAAERLMERSGRRWGWAAAIGATILAAPAFDSLRGSHAGAEQWPRVVTSHFPLRLASSEPLSEIVDIVREEAPAEAVLVTRETGFDLVALTARPVYVPYDPSYLHGIGYEADRLMRDSRGYDGAEISARRQALHELFEPSTPEARRAAFERIEALGRSVIVIARPETDQGLIAWLEANAAARPLTVSPDYGAWIAASRSDAQ